MTYRRIVQRLPPAGPGDRLPTAGPGGRIRIFLDAGANVVGLLRVIRKLTPIEEQPVIPLDEVIRRFREDPLERITLGGVRSVDVHGIALAYLEWGINDHQEIVPPVYVSDCVAHGNGWEVPYVHYLEVVDCPLGPIWASE